MIGGEWFESIFGRPDEASYESIKNVALEELRNHLGITKKPTHVLCKIQKVKVCLRDFSQTDRFSPILALHVMYLANRLSCL